MRILFINPQGNFDKADSHWMMHPDFGGQLVYVKEIAIEMAKLGHDVDIVTRLIKDDDYPEFSQQFDYYDNVPNLRIVRIPIKNELFIDKELLWEHLNEWTDNIIEFYEKEMVTIDFMTGHYGDGGLACAILKSKIKIPFSFTGHSLGAQKLDKLLSHDLDFKELDKKYHFTKRLLAENIAIKYSSIIFVSTEQEKNEQYSHNLYNEGTKNLNPLKFVVAPPGANIEVFSEVSRFDKDSKLNLKIQSTIDRDIDLNRRLLPFIISASRLDTKKNHIGLIRAYSKSKELQERSNIVISLRGFENAFENYQNASKDEIIILDEIMKVVKENNLKGKVMFINILSQSELAGLYQFMTRLKSIFTLTALYEPFGLAPIEAMSTGLPVAVTKYGGPSEVLYENNVEYGSLIDVKEDSSVIEGLLKVLNNYESYRTKGIARVLSKYTWKATAETYLKEIKQTLKEKNNEEVHINEYFVKLDESLIIKSKYFEEEVK